MEPLSPSTAHRVSKGRPIATGLRALFSGDFYGGSKERFHCLACSKSFAASYLKTTSKLREHVSKCPSLGEDVRRQHGIEAAAPKRKRAKVEPGDDEGVEAAVDCAQSPEFKPKATKAHRNTVHTRSRIATDFERVALSSPASAAFLGNAALADWMTKFRAGCDPSAFRAQGLEILSNGPSHIKSCILFL